MKMIALEHHPHDSRLTIADDDVCQTLSQRMGTGGGTYLLYSEYIRNREERSTRTISKLGYKATKQIQ